VSVHMCTLTCKQKALVVAFLGPSGPDVVVSKGRLFSTVNLAMVSAEEAFKECVTLETKIQLLQKAAFEKVDIEKGLAAFKVRQQAVLCQ
jgi:hypothetical protein